MHICIEVNMNSEATCILQDITKKYSAGETALDSVNLTAFGGQILGIRGKNGAGKSTLLKIMAGVLKPTGGKRILAPGVIHNIGYLPQDISLYESLTGKENLKFWGIAQGLPSRAIQARTAWLLESLDLSDKADEMVSKYSGGMKRRLHLASALMKTPYLLLLDEPTVGSDPHSAALILDLLVHFRNLGSSIVLITHQKDELEQVADRIITLQDGRILTESSCSTEK